MAIEEEVVKLWHDAIVELFELDLSPITGNASDQYYFTNQTLPNETKVRWKGEVYEPLPIEASGFERPTKGQIPQPELTVSNVLGQLVAIVNTLNDLVGAKIVRRRTLLKYLDNGSEPDPTQEFPEDQFYIERKVAESSISITWSLASKIDLEGLKLPKRIITQNYCLWKYRGPECGYTGPAVANEFDRPISIGGSSSPEGAAYIAAYEAFKAAEVALANAEARKNNLFGQKQNACDSETAAIEETLFIFRQGGGIRDYTFTIQDGDGNTIAMFWDGQQVDFNAARPAYQPGPKQRTDRGPGNQNNGTGPVYSVVQYQSGGSGADLQRSVLPFNNSTFGFKDYNGEPVLIVNGSLVEPRIGPFSTGYDLGAYASDGFAPVRSVQKLAYGTGGCSSASAAYDAAEATYSSALASYNAAKSALDAAYAALPAGDDILKRDKCGKRLQSCRLRFGITGALPFGGFPGANLTR